MAAMNRAPRVAIVGAGIGGLAAASALTKRGIEVDVYERADQLGEVGAGVQLGPNAVKVLRALGLEHAVRQIGFEPKNQIVLNWDGTLRSRRLMRGMYQSQFGAPHLTARRVDLHRLLLQEASGSRIHLGKTCITAHSDGATASVAFADGTEAEADVVIGADGIRSAVRERLFGADQPLFTNSMCWRCNVPIECAPTQIKPPGSEMIEREDYFAWYGPNGQVICYPIGDGSTLNIFAGHASEDWVDESWTIPSSREELLAAYAGWNSSLLEILQQVEHCYKWGIFDRDPRTDWVRGRVALLGDAAHPTMPNLAQGANMAIEDGYVLASALDRFKDDVDLALKTYVAERQPRTSEITLQSRENFVRSMKTPPAPPVDRTWIYAFDATRPSA